MWIWFNLIMQMVKYWEIRNKILYEENFTKNELEIKKTNTKNTKWISRIRTTIRTLTLWKAL